MLEIKNVKNNILKNKIPKTIIRCLILFVFMQGFLTLVIQKISGLDSFTSSENFLNPGIKKDKSNNTSSENRVDIDLSDGNFAWRSMEERVLPKTRIQERFDICVLDLVDASKPGHKGVSEESTGLKNEELLNYYKKQGKLVDSDNAYNFAIHGQGFFQVIDKDGKTYYTRNGMFTPDRQGILKNTDGHYLSPHLKITDTELNYSISSDGKFYMTIEGQIPEEIYQFNLYMPTQNSQIESQGSAFTFTEVTPIVINEDNQVLHPNLELSTIDPVKLLVKMTSYLYILKEQDPGTDNALRFYLVDFLLKEYVRSTVLNTKVSLEKFTYLSESFESSLFFSPDKHKKSQPNSIERSD